MLRRTVAGENTGGNSMTDIALRLSEYRYDTLMSFFDAMAFSDCQCAKSMMTEDEWIISGDGETLCEACTASYLAMVIDKEKQRNERIGTALAIPLGTQHDRTEKPKAIVDRRSSHDSTLRWTPT